MIVLRMVGEDNDGTVCDNAEEVEKVVGVGNKDNDRRNVNIEDGDDVMGDEGMYDDNSEGMSDDNSEDSGRVIDEDDRRVNLVDCEDVMGDERMPGDNSDVSDEVEDSGGVEDRVGDDLELEWISDDVRRVNGIGVSNRVEPDTGQVQ